jgi:hypothetical protein
LAGFVTQYNTKRLHSAIGYVTPQDKLEGRARTIHAERDRKLAAAREARRRRRQARRLSCASESGSTHTDGLESPWSSVEQPTRLRVLRGESPRAVSCPIRTASRSDAYARQRRMFCSDVNAMAARRPQSRRGRSNRNGKQIWRPEHNELTAVPKCKGPPRSC